MRRSLLLTTSVLGLLVCLVGGTGLFAALTDSAHTGTNSVDSAALPGSADLQLATAAAAGGITCDTFSDNLATPLFSQSDLQFNQGNSRAFCIRNVGSAPLSLTAAVDQLTDVDIDCTGDEQANGDTTCGGDGPGELAAVLETGIDEKDCVTGGNGALYGPASLSNAQDPGSLGSIGAGETKCYMIYIVYGVNAGTIPRQQSQSDRVTWRYVFTGQA